MSSSSPKLGAILLASCAIAPLSGCGGGGGGSTVSVTVPSSAPAPSATSAGAKPAATATSARAKKPAATTSHAQGNAPATTPGGASTSASTQSASPPPSGQLIRRFTGTGSGRLGTIVVNVPSVLIWHAQRTPIQIFTSSGFLLVQSGTANGSVRLSKGTYRGARVATRAGWSIELRTQAS